jgi:endonuclease YncB( thermonuclease family)
VIDGDTLLIQTKEKAVAVDLLGVDAPDLLGEKEEEGNNPLLYGLPFSAGTKKALLKWVAPAREALSERLGTRGTVLVRPAGKEGERRLARVYLKKGGKPVGLAMVEAGLARVTTARRDFPQEAVYLAAQVTAMAERKGLWQLRPEKAAGPPFVLGTHVNAAGLDRENINDEYIVVGNVGAKPRDLSGHILVDSRAHHFVFPDGTKLASGQSIAIRTGTGQDDEWNLYQGRKQSVWNNDGDVVYLLSTEGEEIVRAAYMR